MKQDKLSLLDIEIAVSEYFDIRRNIIVPNISWGLFIHECDLFVLTKTGYAYEVEIKTSVSDLKRDRLKPHGHINKKVRKLYFAMPETMYVQELQEYIPERAGILLISERDNGQIVCSKFREAKANPFSIVLSKDIQFQVARLGSMRLWTYKKILRGRQDGKTPVS